MKILHEYGSLVSGTLLKRYKRFLADVKLDDGRTVTSYTSNTGSMKTCSDPGSPVMLACNPGRNRKTEFTLEMVKSGDTWVGVNTILANALGARIIDEALTGFSELDGFRVAGREVAVENSRLDLVASDGSGTCYIEIKNVTYREKDYALFPDAATDRGRKHLAALTRRARAGDLACSLFIIPRSDCRIFAPASRIDPLYARTLGLAAQAGVLIVPCLLHVEPEAVFFSRTLPLARTWE